MVVPRLIERKRDGGTLTGDEWRELIAHYATDRVPDYQMAALAMAIYFRGLTPDELGALTGAMLDSGSRLPRSGGGAVRVDKHSTGGVGDKTSLILAPLLAACGVAVPMMSGRGLGHTGGTLDKLESIPGFTTRMPLDRAAAQLDTLGVVMFGQTEEIVPADRRLYSLRDVTGTVESIPLITASIMSKKLAEQLDALVLDVKVGSGAFMPAMDDARTLARTMIGVGEQAGCRTVALLTAMDRPLGRAAGNAIEVVESIHSLRGDGPDDLMEVTLALGVEMLLIAGGADSREAALDTLHAAIRSGAALEKFRAVIAAQGGDPRVVDEPSLLPTAPVIREVHAGQSGRMPPLPPRSLGELIITLGGGRRVAADNVDPAVGLEIVPRAGQPVERGDLIATVHARSGADAAAAATSLGRSIELAWQEQAEPLPLIVERITAAGTTPWQEVR
ncbi:MAG: thymidine phosphorylase [Gemmatimonadales bacterium]|nr:thymidine phosphorylase [Gemmatimonadales bacterium]